MRTSRVSPKGSMFGRAMACVMLLGMTGCHLPYLRCADPGPVTPDTYNGTTSSENSAQFGICEFFDDPVLTQLLTQGLAQNQELKIRNQEIQIARNEIMARKGAYLPFVTVGAGGGFEKPSLYTPLGAAEDQLTYPGDNPFPDPLPNVKLSANLFWQIDIWRQLRNARDAARLRYSEAMEARNFVITRLVAETAENYYELAALDKRLEFIDQTIAIQEQSLDVAQAQKAAARGTELAVQRFLAEVRKNQSQRLIIKQQIIETENKINFLVGRYPQVVERESWDYINLGTRMVQVGIPAQLLSNRRDIRAAELEVAASGLDVKVARANFYPRLDLYAGVGFEAFNPRYLFDPGAFIANTAGELVAPLINRCAIKAEYLNANARQLQAIYNYQRTVLNAFTEVVNSMNAVENFRRSVEIKQQQVKALEESVNVATDLFQNARAEYIDVLFSQRDLLEARVVLIETKQKQLAAIVKAYQALGGGYLLNSSGEEFCVLFCNPCKMCFQEVGAPAMPSEESIVPVPMDGSLPPPAASAIVEPEVMDAETLPPPAEVDAVPVMPEKTTP